MSVNVYPAGKLLESIRSNPNTFLKVISKKDSKTYKGTKFYNTKFLVDGKDVEGWISYKDLPVSSIADPSNVEDKRNEHKGTRLQLSTGLSKAGVLGEFIDALEASYFAEVQKLIDSGKICMEGKKIRPLIQRLYSRKNADEAKRGKPLEEPVLRFKIDFSVYPPKYPSNFLRGLPKTQLYDYTKKIVDKDGKEDYAPATVLNDNGQEEAVGEANLHKFITPGSVVKMIRIIMNTVSDSDSWVSFSALASKVVVEPGAEGGFNEYDESVTLPTVSKPVTPVGPPPEPTPQAETPQAETPRVEKIDDAAILAAFDSMEV